MLTESTHYAWIHQVFFNAIPIVNLEQQTGFVLITQNNSAKKLTLALIWVKYDCFTSLFKEQPQHVNIELKNKLPFESTF